MTKTRLRVGLIILVVAGIGAWGIAATHAASFAIAVEAEDGVLTGSQGPGDTAGASKNASVRFGSVVVAPTNVAAVTGGNSVAVLWDASTSANVTAYDVYRDNAKIATVQIGAGVLKSDKHGTRYIDKTITKGTTYRYQVRATGAGGTQSPLTAQVSATPPTNTTPVPTVTIDTVGAPDLTDYMQNTMKPEIEAWYPKVADRLAFPSYTPFGGTVHVFVDPTYTGVAEVGGGMPAGWIKVNPSYLRGDLEPGAEGMLMHEATHVIQGYPGDPTGWATEGMADWTREWLMRERYKVITPKPNSHLTDGYSEGSYTLQWAENISPGFIRKLNIALHNGTYTSTFVSGLTGKTDQQLYTDMKNQFKGATGSFKLGGKCLDVLNGGTDVGTKLQLLTCNSASVNQKFTVYYRDAGLNGTTKTRFDIINSALAGAIDRCVDVSSSGTDSGTIVQSWSCNNGAAQEWKLGANGSIVNTNSGKCLATTGDSTADGAQLIINDCNGNTSQNWTLP